MYTWTRRQGPVATSCIKVNLLDFHTGVDGDDYAGLRFLG